MQYVFKDVEKCINYSLSKLHIEMYLISFFLLKLFGLFLIHNIDIYIYSNEMCSIKAKTFNNRENNIQLENIK